jgi:hypothetical protein
MISFLLTAGGVLDFQQWKSYYKKTSLTQGETVVNYLGFKNFLNLVYSLSDVIEGQCNIKSQVLPLYFYFTMQLLE